MFLISLVLCFAGFLSKKAVAQTFITNLFPANGASVVEGSIAFKVQTASNPAVLNVTMAVQRQGGEIQTWEMQSTPSSLPGTVEYKWDSYVLSAGTYCWSAVVYFDPTGISLAASIKTWLHCFEVQAKPAPTSFPSPVPSFRPSKIPTGQPFSPIPMSMTVTIVPDQYYIEDNTFWHVRKNNQIFFDQDFDNSTIPINAGRYCFNIIDGWGDGIAQGSYEVRVTTPVHSSGLTLYTGGKFKFSTGDLCFDVMEDGQVYNSEPEPTALCPASDPNKFNMCIQTVDLSLNSTLELNGLAQEFEQAFLAAKSRWEDVIQGDDGTSHTTYYGLDIDDLHLFAVVKEIDGAGGTLAFASPSLTEEINGKVKSYTGYMVFDKEDIQNLMNKGTFQDVAVHEIGHVLGLGTLWKDNGLFDRNNTAAGYNGLNANREFRNYLHASGGEINVNDPNIKVPIELDGGEGTAFGHWDENCLNHETMTGFLDNFNRLSKITIGGLDDLGFLVDYDKADIYNLPEARVINCMDQINNNRMLKGMQKRSLKHRSSRVLYGRADRGLSEQEISEAVGSGKEYLARCKKATFSVQLGEKTKEMGCEAVEVVYEAADGSLHGVDVDYDEGDHDLFARR